MSQPDEGLTEVIFLGIAAAVAYYLYKQFASGVSSLTAPITTGAANAFVSLTAGPAAQTTGTIQMPDGSQVATSAIKMTDMSSNQFSYGGSTYTLSEDANGDWVAN